MPLFSIVPAKSPGRTGRLYSSSNPISDSAGALCSAGILLIAWHTPALLVGAPHCTCSSAVTAVRESESQCIYSGNVYGSRQLQIVEGGRRVSLAQTPGHMPQRCVQRWIHQPANSSSHPQNYAGSERPLCLPSPLVLHLERDAWSMVKWLRQATNEGVSPPPRRSYL